MTVSSAAFNNGRLPSEDLSNEWIGWIHHFWWRICTFDMQWIKFDSFKTHALSLHSPLPSMYFGDLRGIWTRGDNGRFLPEGLSNKWLESITQFLVKNIGLWYARNEIWRYWHSRSVVTWPSVFHVRGVAWKIWIHITKPKRKIRCNWIWVAFLCENNWEVAINLSLIKTISYFRSEKTVDLQITLHVF